MGDEGDKERRRSKPSKDPESSQKRAARKRSATSEVAPEDTRSPPGASASVPTPGLAGKQSKKKKKRREDSKGKFGERRKSTDQSRSSSTRRSGFTVTRLDGAPSTATCISTSSGKQRSMKSKRRESSADQVAGTSGAMGPTGTRGASRPSSRKISSFTVSYSAEASASRKRKRPRTAPSQSWLEYVHSQLVDVFNEETPTSERSPDRSSKKSKKRKHKKARKMTEEGRTSSNDSSPRVTIKIDKSPSEKRKSSKLPQETESDATGRPGPSGAVDRLRAPRVFPRGQRSPSKDSESSVDSPTQKDRAGHLENGQGRKFHSCDECGRVCDNEASLALHKRTVHKIELICSTCDESFETELSYDQHRARDPVHECDYCVMNFDTALLRDIHCRQQHLYACTTCKRTLESSQKLLDHHNRGKCTWRRRGGV